jgi:hypothetical protein
MQPYTTSNPLIIVSGAGVAAALLIAGASSALALPAGCKNNPSCQEETRLIAGRGVVIFRRKCNYLSDCTDKNQNTDKTCGDCVEGRCH